MQKIISHHQCRNCETSSFFCDINQEESDSLKLSINFMSFKKDQDIYKKGSLIYGLYCLKKGKIKIFKTGTYGKEQIIHLVKEGELFGYHEMIGNEKYRSSANALEDCSVCFIPKEEFNKLMGNNNNISKNLMLLLAKDLSESHLNHTNSIQKPVRERMAETLILIIKAYGFEDDGKTINAYLKREDIANITGVTLETLVRFLTDMKNEKIIESDKKKIKIIDYKELFRIAKIIN